MAELNKKLIRRWVKALRSGKYRQAQGVLHDTEGAYCCLGVVCNLIDPDKWTKGAWFAPDTEDAKGYAWGRRVLPRDGNPSDSVPWDSLTLPAASVIDKLGMDAQFVKELAWANDDGDSFESIAHRIEERYLADA